MTIKNAGYHSLVPQKSCSFASRGTQIYRQRGHTFSPPLFIDASLTSDGNKNSCNDITSSVLTVAWSLKRKTSSLVRSVTKPIEVGPAPDVKSNATPELPQ